MTLTIAVAYGGREEIVDAVRKLLKAQAKWDKSMPDLIESITPEAIAGNLYAADLPDPDLIIRTSGEIRLSGFFFGRVCTVSFTSPTSYGRPFEGLISSLIRAYQARNRPARPLTKEAYDGGFRRRPKPKESGLIAIRVKHGRRLG